MLHILWMFLKIILIILAVILGIVLLAVLLVLFCPVCYRADGRKEPDTGIRDARASAGVSWLFGGIRVGISYIGGKPELCIRALGIDLQKLLAGIRKKKTVSGTKKREEPPELLISELKPEPIPGPELKPEPIPGPELKPEPISEPEPKPVLPEAVTEPTEPEPIPEPVQEKASGPAVNLIVEEQPVRAAESPKERKPKPKVGEKLRQIPQKIEAAKKKASDTFTKLSWWKEFLTNERTTEAISLILREAGGLIRHILPRKLWGEVTFGFEDPSITGRILGFLGMTIPFHRNRVKVHPRFECENVLYGEIHLRGRIFGIVFLLAALRILINRNVHDVIKRWKHKEA